MLNEYDDGNGTSYDEFWAAYNADPCPKQEDMCINGKEHDWHGTWNDEDEYTSVCSVCGEKSVTKYDPIIGDIPF